MKKYPVILVILYVACELIANITAGKLTTVGGLVVPAAVYIFTVSYTLLDLINRVLGKEEARRIVKGAFLANLLLAFYVTFAIRLPFPVFWQGQEAFVTTLANTPRITLASLTAYYLSSNIDIIFYHLLKDKAAPWLRVLASNSVSLFVDTLVFITIAFAGLMPLLPLIKGQYLVKLGTTIFTIPLIYLTRFLGEREECCAPASKGEA
ncbi:MAG: queuosine precursor transporter [Bacillota bacterium]